MTKACVVCGKQFAMRDNDTLSSYRKRSTCSPECSCERRVRFGQSKAITLKPKWCPICGVQYERGERECAGSFRKRATCSMECGVEYRRRARIKLVDRKHPYPPEWNRELRDRIRDRDGRQCRICGATRKKGERDLHIHHIDWNKANYSEDNLITLCRPCHGAVHRKKERAVWRERLMRLVSQSVAV